MSTELLSGTDSNMAKNKDHDELVASHLDEPKARFYKSDMPNAPPAIIEDSDVEAIWFEEIEDSEVVIEIASSLGFKEVGEGDMVIKVIFTDFTEFFFPIKWNEGEYTSTLDTLKDDYMPSVARYNDEIEYDGDIESFEIGDDPSEDKESLTADEMFGEHTDNKDGPDEDDDISLESL